MVYVIGLELVKWIFEMAYTDILWHILISKNLSPQVLALAYHLNRSHHKLFHFKQKKYNNSI